MSEQSESRSYADTISSLELVHNFTLESMINIIEPYVPDANELKGIKSYIGKSNIFLGVASVGATYAEAPEGQKVTAVSKGLFEGAVASAAGECRFLRHVLNCVYEGRV